MMKLNATGKKRKGQGIVEYAGAIVVATVLVGAVLAVGPQAMGDMFKNVIGGISTSLTSKASSALGSGSSSGGSTTP